MLTQRQPNEIYSFVEVSQATVNPGTVNATTRFSVTVNPTLAGTAEPSACLPGDLVEAIPPIAAEPTGFLMWSAYVSAPGTIIIAGINANSSGVTPTSAVWTFVTKRISPAGVY